MITSCVQYSCEQMANAANDCFEKFQYKNNEEIDENLQRSKNLAPESLKDHLGSASKSSRDMFYKNHIRFRFDHLYRDLSLTQHPRILWVNKAD